VRELSSHATAPAVRRLRINLDRNVVHAKSVSEKRRGRCVPVFVEHWRSYSSQTLHHHMSPSSRRSHIGARLPNH
jgi:hypothetical protein